MAATSSERSQAINSVFQDYEPIPQSQNLNPIYNHDPTWQFKKAAKHFTVSRNIQFIYAIIISLTAFFLFLLYLKAPLCQQNANLTISLFLHLDLLIYWLILAFFHGLIFAIYTYLLMDWFSHEANQRVVAFKLGEILQGEERQSRYHSAINQSKKTSAMALLIKAEAVKSSITTKMLRGVTFLTQQIIFFSGLGLAYLYYGSLTGCQVQIYEFLCIVLMITAYWHSEFYLVLFLVILFLPILLIILIFYGLSLCLKRQKNQEVMERLNKIQYAPHKIEGDNVCSICQTAYELDDEVVVLPCSNLHHFHYSCLQHWLTVSNTCPLCRVQVRPQGMQYQ